MSSSSSANMSSINEIKESYKKEIKKYRLLIEKQHLRLLMKSKQMKVMRCTIATLRKKINNDNYKKTLSTIFNKDQMLALMNKKRICNWSNETIQRSLKLNLACGVSGYNEILQQGIPLPSLRTLRRRLENCKFEPGISKQI